METLPEPRSTERVLLHRIGKFNSGQGLCARQLLQIWDEARPASRSARVAGS